MVTMQQRRISALAAALLTAAVLAACGSSSKSSSHTTQAKSSAATSSTSSTTPAASTSAIKPAVDELPAAEHPTAGQFPATHGRTLQQLANLVHTSAQFGAATGSFTPGTRRLAFALNASSGAFIYAPTALYIATGPNAKHVDGPILAPADPTGVAPQYRSKQNAGPGGITAIYGAQIPLPHSGTYAVLTLTKGPSGLIGATGEVAVAPSSPIPDVGQRAPSIATDTPATVHGNTSLLTTRIPPDDMHAVSFNQVLGKQPAVLLFSTPQLCVSRVCGPVTDLIVSLEHEFKGKIAFIHEEVYVDNTPSKGLRPQMKAFHLQTEPWLFTVNRQGVITSRLEGAFGINEARAALEAALK
jgi:hypothetical protein